MVRFSHIYFVFVFVFVCEGKSVVAEEHKFTKDGFYSILLIDSVFGDNLLSEYKLENYKSVMSEFKNLYLDNPLPQKRLFYNSLNNYYGITTKQNLYNYNSMLIKLLNQNYPLAYFWLGLNELNASSKRAQFYLKKSYCLGYIDSAIYLAKIYGGTSGLGRFHFKKNAMRDLGKYREWMSRVPSKNIDMSVCADDN